VGFIFKGKYSVKYFNFRLFLKYLKLISPPREVKIIPNIISNKIKKGFSFLPKFNSNIKSKKVSTKLIVPTFNDF